jgi:hypothetical protein
VEERERNNNDTNPEANTVDTTTVKLFQNYIHSKWHDQTEDN